MLILYFVLTVMWSFLLAMMIRHRLKWGRIVDRENEFWVRKGVLSRSTGERIKRFEKGLGLKILVVLNLIGFLALFIIELIIRLLERG